MAVIRSHDAATEESLAARRLSAVADLSLRFLQILRQRQPVDAGDDIVRWQYLVQQLLGHPRGQDALVALFSWFLAGGPAGEEVLRTVMTRIHDSATRQTMKSALDELLERGFAKGLEQGREEGREEGHTRGQRELLRRLLAQRFGAIPADVDARLAAGSLADVEAWGMRMLTATSLADVFDR